MTVPTVEGAIAVSTPPTRVRARRISSIPGGSIAYGFVVPIAVLILWQLATLFVSTSAMASPVETWRATIEGITDGWLPTNLWITLRVVLQAFVVASVLGLLAGAWLGMSRFWGDVLSAPVVWLSALPKVTVFPIFLLVLGLGDSSRMAFGAFHGVFPLIIIVFGGIRAIPNVYFRAAASMNLNWWETAVRVVLPAALPSVLSGLRFCFSLCFLGVVLAEMFGSEAGAGYELVHLISLHRLPQIFALALSLMLIALILNFALIALENRAGHRGRVDRPKASG
jgi:ABC-type nitrate/sulfonate/bicarbonate transport system permease component